MIETGDRFPVPTPEIPIPNMTEGYKGAAVREGLMLLPASMNIDTGAFDFSNNPEDPSENIVKATLFARTPKFTHVAFHRLANRAEPPTVVDSIGFADGVSEEAMLAVEKRIMEHNAAQIAVFLRAGGDVKEIPKTQYPPNLPELNYPPIDAR